MTEITFCCVSGLLMPKQYNVWLCDKVVCLSVLVVTRTFSLGTPFNDQVANNH